MSFSNLGHEQVSMLNSTRNHVYFFMAPHRTFSQTNTIILQHLLEAIDNVWKNLFQTTWESGLFHAHTRDYR